MKIRYLLAFSMLVLVLSLPFAFAGENSTDEIGAVEDAVTVERNVSGNTFADIQEAVNSAGDNDVVMLNGTYTASGDAIELKKNLVFDGGPQRATLDGNGNSSIFKTYSSDYTITLKNMDFINAKGFVFSGGGKLVVDNCSFTNNTADEYGIIRCEDCVVENSEFIGNKGVCGGAIYGFDEIIVNYSRFINNTASNGGAISLSDSARRLSIDNCLFDGNYAQIYGGSIYSVRELSLGVEEVNTNLVISNSNTTNSKAGKNGGAVYCVCADLNLNYVNINSSGSCIEIYHDFGEFKSSNSTYNTIKSTPVHDAALSADKVTAYYDSDGELTVTMYDYNLSRNVMYAKVKVKVWAGKTSKEYVLPLYYDGAAVAVLKIDKRFGAGKHKVEITSLSRYFNAKKITTYIIVKKAKTIVKAPTVKAKYKKSKKFKVTVKLDRYNPLAKVKIKIKVYTGKKSKTYKVKTNRKGVASINTKKLKRGTHKVVISSLNKNYSISKKSKIIIK